MHVPALETRQAWQVGTLPLAAQNDGDRPGKHVKSTKHRNLLTVDYVGKNKQNDRYRDLRDEEDGHEEVDSCPGGAGRATGDLIEVEALRVREEVRERARKVRRRLSEERRQGH